MSAKKTTSAILLLLALAMAKALAQSYSINWYNVSGGGGASTGTNGASVYSINGTTGQHDASGSLTGGNYSLIGGFWSLIAVQTPGAPILNITYINNQAVVSWPLSATGWTLQTNSNITTTNWVNYGGPVENNSVTNSSPIGKLFFRLIKP